MVSFFKALRGNGAKKHAQAAPVKAAEPTRKRWDDPWQRKSVEPEEIQELLGSLVAEIKAKALDLPFLLLPFRPASDPSAARTFVRNYFNAEFDRGYPLKGERLVQELKLAEPWVLCSVMKWCWSRLSGGVVTWEAYHLFKLGETDSKMARNAFSTFIPLSINNGARTKIIYTFFDLLASVAAHGKTNGMTGRNLSRYAGWWAFSHSDGTQGFDTGYKSWSVAADAASHLFFAYLRSLSPDSGQGKSGGILALPLSLQALLEATEYPPESRFSLQTEVTKVAMIVNKVSPTPFALLRRTQLFEYRDEDEALREFSAYDDPVDALTPECQRIIKSISSANDTSSTETSTSLKDASWSRFEDIGFSSLIDKPNNNTPISPIKTHNDANALSTTNRSTINLGRPTTPSWADFLSSGFVDDNQRQTILLSPEERLPPITLRGQSAHSHSTADMQNLEPGEVASIKMISIDDTFWWAWMSSLAGEETAERKATFGRCAMIETQVGYTTDTRWLLLEEVMRSAALPVDPQAYVAEKKSRFTFGRKQKSVRDRGNRMSTISSRRMAQQNESMASLGSSQAPISPEQQAKIQAAAHALNERNRREKASANVPPSSPRRGRQAPDAEAKTASTMTLQPFILKEAGPAMKWANSYDKATIRAQYLGDSKAGRGGSSMDLANLATSNGSTPTLRDKAPARPSSKPSTPTSATAMAAAKVASMPSATKVPTLSSTAKPRDESEAYKPIDPAFVQMISTGPTNNATSPIAEKPPAPKTAQTPSKSQVPVSNGAAKSSSPPIMTTTNMQQYPKPMTRLTTPTQPGYLPLATANKEFAPGPAYNELPSPPKAVETSMASPGEKDRPTSPQKLHKRKALPNAAGTGGFKSLFSRKKQLDENANAAQGRGVKPSPELSSAVAAARAALEAKAQAAHAPVPAPQVVKARRYSRKMPEMDSAPEVAGASESANPDSAQYLQPLTEPTKQHWVPEGTTTVVDGFSDVPPSASRDHDELNGGANHFKSRSVDTEERNAENEFRNFDYDSLAPRPGHHQNQASMSTTHRDGNRDSMFTMPVTDFDNRSVKDTFEPGSDEVPELPASDVADYQDQSDAMLHPAMRDTVVNSSSMAPPPFLLHKHSIGAPSINTVHTADSGAMFSQDSIVPNHAAIAASAVPSTMAHSQDLAAPAELAPAAVPRVHDGPVTDPDAHKRSSGLDISEGPPTMGISADRWAQIRKNAAQRMGRPSEDLSAEAGNTDFHAGTLPDADDAGQEDEEETIESRVARIKARVAELTGNMDMPRPIRGT